MVVRLGATQGSTEKSSIWPQSALVCGTVVKLGRGSWIPAVCEVNYVQSGTTTFLMVSLCRSAGCFVCCFGCILLGRCDHPAAIAPAVPMQTSHAINTIAAAFIAHAHECTLDAPRCRCAPVWPSEANKGPAAPHVL